MDDLISRQAAIDAVNDAFDRETLLTGFVRSISARAIRDIPSAQREGKWIKEHEEWFTDYPYKCTNCGKYSRARYHFCPNCGADMRGVIKR